MQARRRSHALSLVRVHALSWGRSVLDGSEPHSVKGVRRGACSCALAVMPRFARFFPSLSPLRLTRAPGGVRDRARMQEETVASFDPTTRSGTKENDSQLAKQDLSTLDVAKLTPLSPEARAHASRRMCCCWCSRRRLSFCRSFRARQPSTSVATAMGRGTCCAHPCATRHHRPRGPRQVDGRALHLVGQDRQALHRASAGRCVVCAGLR